MTGRQDDRQRILAKYMIFHVFIHELCKVQRNTIKFRSPQHLLGFHWHIWICRSRPKEGSRMVFKFFWAPSIFHWNTRISCGKCDCELAFKVSCLFLSVPANHRLSILSNDKSELAYCWFLTKRVGAPPANEKLGHWLTQTLLTNRMQRQLQNH